MCPGSEETGEGGGPIMHSTQQQPATQQDNNKGFIQRLKDMFWKPEETEPEITEMDKESQKMK